MWRKVYAGVMELADVLDSKSSSERSAGSTPTRATRNKKYPKWDIFYFCLWFLELNKKTLDKSFFLYYIKSITQQKRIKYVRKSKKIFGKDISKDTFNEFDESVSRKDRKIIIKAVNYAFGE